MIDIVNHKDCPRSRQIASLLAAFKYMLEEMTQNQLDELDRRMMYTPTMTNDENALVEAFGLDTTEE